MMYLDGNGKRTEAKMFLGCRGINICWWQVSLVPFVGYSPIFYNFNDNQSGLLRSQQNDLEDEKREAIQAILNPLAFITSDF
eukprot:scaffold10145_cov154-Chaetoceros_neogracile.AAC.1